MGSYARFFFAGESFEGREEYAGFRFLFLGVIMLLGAFNSLLLLVGDSLGINPIPEADLIAMRVHIGASLFLFFLLRGHQRLYLPISLAYGALCLYVVTAALLYVPGDELRIIWFFLAIPSYYLLLGRAAGVVITFVSMAILGIANLYSAAPYSHNAVATGLSGLVYTSLFFYVYSERALSFFNRMVDSNEQQRALATLDPLTGLYNARAYYGIADRLIAVARREQAPYSVFFLDLDHFKAVNDNYGHEIGDQVLSGVARTIREQLRESDVVARVGGEEFSVFLPRTGLEGARVLAEKLRASIASLAIPLSSGQTLRITASIGIAESREPGCDMASLQREADLAMYEAKRQGRNRVCELPLAAG